jgi:hypothetical protein
MAALARVEDHIVIGHCRTASVPWKKDFCLIEAKLGLVPHL